MSESNIKRIIIIAGIIVIVILTILLVVPYFTDNGQDQATDLTQETTLVQGPIDDLIQEAKQLAAEGRLSEALVKLIQAGSTYYQPSDEQLATIRQLYESYRQQLADKIEEEGLPIELPPDFDTAMEEYSESLVDDPVPALIQEARDLVNQGQCVEALRRLQDALTRNPTPDFLNVINNMINECKQSLDGDEYSEKAAVDNMLIEIQEQMDQGNYEQAQRLLEQAQNLNLTRDQQQRLNTMEDRISQALREPVPSAQTSEQAADNNQYRPSQNNIAQTQQETQRPTQPTRPSQQQTQQDQQTTRTTDNQQQTQTHPADPASQQDRTTQTPQRDNQRETQTNAQQNQRNNQTANRTNQNQRDNPQQNQNNQTQSEQTTNRNNQQQDQTTETAEGTEQQQETTAEELVRQGIELMDQAQYETAIEKFNEALQRDRNLQQAYSYRGTAQYMLGNYDEALQSSRRALQLDDNDANAHFIIGEIHYDREQDDNAFEHYLRAAELDPANAYAVYKMGVILLLKEKYEDSIRHFLVSIDMGSLDPITMRNAYYNVGLANEKIYNLSLNEEESNQNAFDLAQRSYKVAITMDPSFVEAYITLGQLFYKAEDYDNALEYLKRGERVDDTNFQIQFKIGNVYSAMKDYEQAETYYKNAAALNANNYNALFNLANTQLNLEKYEEAADNFVSAMEISQNDPDLYIGFGIAMLELDQLDESLSSFQKAVRIDRQSADGYTGQGLVYYKKEDYRNALQAFQRASNLVEDSPLILYHMGVTQFKLENFTQAITLLSSSLDILQSIEETELEEMNDTTPLGLPDVVMVQKGLGMSYLGAQRYQEAIDTLLAISTAIPNDIEVQHRLGEAYMMVDNKNEAKRWLQKAQSSRDFDTYEGKEEILEILQVL